jgi:hypothetical protein
MRKTRSLIRTYCLTGLAAAVGSAAAQLGLGWLSIDVFRPEHPEVAAWRLWNELFERLTWMTALLTSLELLALLCAFDLVAKARTGWVMTVAGAVPAMILGVGWVLSSSIHFNTPLKAVGFVGLFIGLTFASLKLVLAFDRPRNPAG